MAACPTILESKMKGFFPCVKLGTLSWNQVNTVESSARVSEAGQAGSGGPN